MAKGIFISFEGSEACGKSTQIDRLKTRLEVLGVEVVASREPGGTALGESIRHLLKYAPEGVGMTPESELLLFEASRAQLVREVIEPALARGAVVICDRFMDSTTVYQGLARKIDPEMVAALNRFAVGGAVPDWTFVLDLDPEEGRKRIVSRGDQRVDRMEQEPLDFYRQVREGYLALAKVNPDRMMVIDGSQSPEQIAELLWTTLINQFHGVFERHRI